jgi:hypothetical protein
VSAEGQVYDGFDPDIHVIDRFDIPKQWTRYRAIDFGYTNPFVCQWWAQDHDGRLYLYREIYMTRRTVKVHSEQIHRLSAGETYAFTVSDHDAEDRATLAENGIYTTAAVKDISPGIQAVEERLKVRIPRRYTARQHRTGVWQLCVAGRQRRQAEQRSPDGCLQSWHGCDALHGDGCG